jgi:hypothetical protein
MDIVPDGAGAFAVNKPVTNSHVQEMIDVGVFCQGIINYIRRFNRKVVPSDPNFRDFRYDGGTWANQRYFADFIRPFNRYVYIPRGALIGRYFKWAGAPGFSAVVDQGHVGVLLQAQDLKNQQGGMLLHSLSRGLVLQLLDTFPRLDQLRRGRVLVRQRTFPSRGR